MIVHIIIYYIQYPLVHQIQVEMLVGLLILSTLLVLGVLVGMVLMMVCLPLLVMLRLVLLPLALAAWLSNFMTNNRAASPCL